MQALHQPQKRTLKTTLRVLLGFWIIAGLGIGTAYWFNLRSHGQMLNLGDTAPTFFLQDQDGRPHKLTDYRGRPVAIAFLPDLNNESITQLQSMNAAIRQFDTLGVKVFAIAPTTPETAKRVHDTKNLNFPILVDAQQGVMEKYGADTPTDAGKRLSYVVDAEGKVLLPIKTVHTADHGAQLVELAECCIDQKPVAPSRLIGKQIADFQLPRVGDGKQETLYGDKQQHLTVLYILSAQCPCSGTYDARVSELAKSYAPKGVRFLALNASANETPQEIALYAKKANYPFPVLKDDKNLIADKIEAKVTPEVFVMDTKGILRYHGRIDDSRKPSEVKAHDLRNALDFLLAGQAPAKPDVATFGCAIYRDPQTFRVTSLGKSR
jgi:peroxiredoxin